MLRADSLFCIAGAAAGLASAFACWFLLPGGSDLTAELALGTHTVVSCAFGWATHYWLGARAIDKRHSALFAAAIALTMPVIGPAGMSAAMVLGRRTAFFKLEEPIERTGAPKLPHRPPELEKNLKFASGGLGDILRHSGDVSKRVLAVTAASRMTERDAIPFLKIAMSDTADEVRLLAFSVKDKIETGINEKIKNNLAELPNLSETDRPTVHRALAFLYWELVYLNIAEGDLRTFMLKEADEHAEQCLTHTNEASLHTLRGRIALERRQAGEAQQHFESALAAGAEAENVATYLAEAAFIADDFPSVRKHLEALPMHFRATAPFHALCRKWELT